MPDAVYTKDPPFDMAVVDIGGKVSIRVCVCAHIGVLSFSLLSPASSPMRTHKHVQGIPWDHKEGQIGDDVETVDGEAVVMGKKYQFPEAGWTRVFLCS